MFVFRACLEEVIGIEMKVSELWDGDESIEKRRGLLRLEEREEVVDRKAMNCIKWSEHDREHNEGWEQLPSLNQFLSFLNMMIRILLPFSFQSFSFFLSLSFQAHSPSSFPRLSFHCSFHFPPSPFPPFISGIGRGDSGKVWGGCYAYLKTEIWEKSSICRLVSVETRYEFGMDK